ncbi:alkaline shock response membrane anchor protein AmaP [Olsenella uli]|uniref:alkaline shock response membrane anchor protein AmaP n=1 Tax=Olsenella uli TaxID=133926 RepID=UPI00195A4DE3|nr:alkaline shock response membrane anchor protein AmaP [Olsenella uli]MBM6675510.1 alkaline shock response membrane anchor protein AmaP [Olsenella uli]
MRGLKRLCTVIFVLADLFALGALTLTWYGPWTDAATSLLYLEPYALAVFACLVVSGLGLLVLLVRALFAGRRVRTVEVASVDGGVISVTRDAIAAQASHIVEADGTCTAARVRVDAKPRGHVRVHVRVLPRQTVDVVAKGAELHTELVDGLAAVCGDTVENVSLEFVEPESVTLAAHEEGVEATAEAAPEPAAASPDDTTSEITVSMGPARETEREA